ncbi:hypothetical protein EHI8A_127790 [Entamoeba histolytica HM-1:IMSS-B]|nr:hypothetical protein EHI8A_127790 [Entamoeba histolytica HM-1:IMSS-B]
MFIWLAFLIGVFALNLRDSLDDFLDNLDNDELFHEEDEYNEDEEYNLEDELEEEEDEMDYESYENDDDMYEDLDENEFDLQQVDVQFPFSKEVEGNTPSTIFDSAERLLVELQIPAFAGLRPVY